MTRMFSKRYWNTKVYSGLSYKYVLTNGLPRLSSGKSLLHLIQIIDNTKLMFGITNNNGICVRFHDVRGMINNAYKEITNMINVLFFSVNPLRGSNIRLSSRPNIYWMILIQSTDVGMLLKFIQLFPLTNLLYNAVSRQFKQLLQESDDSSDEFTALYSILSRNRDRFTLSEENDFQLIYDSTLTE